MSNAERQAAHRLRVKNRLNGNELKKPPKKSTNKTRSAIRDEIVYQIEALAQRFQAQLDTLPENLSTSTKADRLAQAVEELTDVADQLRDVELI